MTNINNLKSVIMNRISAEVSTVQDVSDYDKIVFSGFPAVTVTTADNDNEFWSTGENQRAFNFDLDVYIQISKNTQTPDDNGMQSAERIMGNVVSDILDAFDSYTTFGGAADMLKAAPSVWDYIQTSEGWMRHAKIKLQIVQLHVV